MWRICDNTKIKNTLAKLIYSTGWPEPIGSPGALPSQIARSPSIYNIYKMVLKNNACENKDTKHPTRLLSDNINLPQ